MTKRHRSAVTGEYVTAEQANADPERTVSESMTLKVDTSELTQLLDDIKEQVVDRMASLEAEVGMLQTQVQSLEVAVAELRGNQQTAGPSTEVAGGCQEQDQAEDRD